MSRSIPLFVNAEQHGNATAILSNGESFRYNNLLDVSIRVSSTLLKGEPDLREARVVFQVAPGFDYVAAQWGIWRAGGVAVPLGLQHPPPELEYVIDDTQPVAAIADAEHADRLAPLAESRGIPLCRIEAATQSALSALPSISPDRRAMILYTSGTTSRPKGVVTTHANIQAQVESLVAAWQWSPDDHILCVLPLHHIHGIINVVTCALWSGATCEFFPRFDAEAVLARFTSGGLSLFMAVPTIYSRLIAAWESADAAKQMAVTKACQGMRLMVSGSAALPVSTLERWKEISGHTLLERYGMTEIGMGLSNPYDGERLPGHVGMPLPGVEVRRVDEQGDSVADDVPGEIEVRGPGVFVEYWSHPQATTAAFRDGWFRTGDMAVESEGAFRILGRNSVDIIKTGGYKVSALEIEEVLRTHDDIRECAVVGIKDDEWGERVAVCLVLMAECAIELKALREWAKERLAPYKIPTRLLAVDELPRNAMGKVQKRAIKDLFGE